MRLKRCLLALALSLFATAARAELVVAVDTRLGITRLSREEVVNIFLGRYRKLPSGQAAMPIDQPTSSPLRKEFYRRLVGKDLSEINAYWARLIFSGKTSPPMQTENTEDVGPLIQAIPGGIGYLERSQLTPDLRVVLEMAP